MTEMTVMGRGGETVSETEVLGKKERKEERKNKRKKEQKKE